MNRLQISNQNLIAALRRMAPETGSLICLGCGHERKCSIHGCAVLRAAVDRLTELTAPPPNPPLTLEELREMDGDPVYLVDLEYPDNSGWGIWPCVDVLASYGTSWLAYRRKPEEVVK